jgi:pre-mRNA-splicing helicase BRR2
MYKPHTKETKQTFEYLAGVVHGLLGADQPHDVTLSAADQVLAALKRGVEEDGERETASRALDRKVAVEAVIGPVSPDTFMQMVNLARLINDYHVPAAAAEDVASEDDGGVAVVFAEDDEDGEDGDEYQAALEGDEEFVPSFALVKDEPIAPLDDDQVFLARYF